VITNVGAHIHNHGIGGNQPALIQLRQQLRLKKIARAHERALNAIV
jgi:hypothetical protein